MLSHSQGKNPVRLQQATPRKLAALIKPLNKKQLTRRPAPDKWSIAEILAHLADAELVIGYRIASHPGFERYGDSGLRSGRLGRDLQLQPARPKDLAGNLPRAAREQPEAFEFGAANAYGRTMVSTRSAGRRPWTIS